MEEVKQIGYTNVFERNRASEARVLINVGGSGSSKSHSIAQLMIWKFLNEKNKQIIVTRKTMPALRRSCYDLIVGLLKEYGVYGYIDHNKTDNVLSCKSNNMWFFGLDEPSKAKSISGGASYIWMEEADEFTFDDYMAFKLQLRRVTKGELNQLYMTFNPIDGSGWIPTKAIIQEDAEVIHSTIDDNLFAEPEYVKALKRMIGEDENSYRIYVLGEWGRLENLIFPNYVLVDSLPGEWDGWCYGLDFGFVHPTALIKSLVHKENLYWDETLFAYGLTNSDLIERLAHFDRGDIYADGAEPQRIAEIGRAGYTVFGANKDVKLGIDVCRRRPIHITKSSVNTIKQIRGYQRRKDKNGNILEQPVKAKDDAMDAGRYGTLGITERFGFATARPSESGPIKSLDFGEAAGNKILDRWMRR